MAEQEKHPAALLLVDVINPLDFDEADDLLRHALPAARRIAALKERARAAGVPVVYANDNFGRWRSDLRAIVERCLEPGCKGRPLVELLRPGEEDYFVLKPMHSAFYGTVLDTLLRDLGTRAVVVCGFAGDLCVFFSANDAYMRGLRLVVPSDGSASNTAEEQEQALRHMRKALKADTRPCGEIDFDAFRHAPR
ncbi:MAG: cysteine hydrolase [Gemmataceae bacterium]|nr:cysteine hydrolase [Gemmataceae bacterium]